MATKEKQIEEQIEVKRFKIQYPVSAYTFPAEARIHQVHLDETYLHIDLTDGRKLAIPLWWIPTLHNAPPEERQKYQVDPSRTMLIWDPNHGTINDEIRLADYFGPLPER